MCSLFITVIPALSQSTAFSYQGRLNDAGLPANGSYDLTFALFNLVSGVAQVGNTITNSATGVTNGVFTVTLDFGANFPGANRWLEIGVRTNGNGPFTTLTPRQALTATPYAIKAISADSATTASGAPPTGNAGGGLTGTYPNPAVASLGPISGASLTGLKAANLSGTVAIANGGTAASSASGARTTMGGIQASTNLASLDKATPTFAQDIGLTPPDYNGQIIVTKYGELLFGRDGAWSGDWQLPGRFAAYARVPSSGNHTLWVTNGIDNCLELRNFDNAHYSAVRCVDLNGDEKCAWGWGNPGSVSTFAGSSYWESFGGGYDMRLVQGVGNGVTWKCEAVSGDWVGYASTGGTPGQGSERMRLTRTGNLSAAGTGFFGGDVQINGIINFNDNGYLKGYANNLAISDNNGVDYLWLKSTGIQFATSSQSFTPISDNNSFVGIPATRFAGASIVNMTNTTLTIKGGSNAKIGTAALVGGTVTVSTTAVTANSVIFATSQADGGTTGSLHINAITPGASFVIRSDNALDTSTVGWWIVEKN